MPLEVPDRDEWFSISEGLPRPDWLFINEWIANVVPAADRIEAADRITRYWLRRLASVLQGSLSVFESEHYFILSDRNQRECQYLTEILDEARAHVLRTLGQRAGIRQTRRLAILRLTTRDETFIVQASIESELEAARKFFRPGIPPYILHEYRSGRTNYSQFAGHVVYHLLSHLALPYWLYYGLGEALECDLTRQPFAVLDKETLETHQDCWNPDSIQSFWSGATFWDQDWRPISLNLAAVFLDIIRREVHPDFGKLQRFIQDAKREDAGEAAAQRFWGIGLGEIAGIFLGEGDWSPQPDTWGKR